MATVAVADPTFRLVIPSRFPPIGAFETVSSADDLEAVMELEGWTNDRLVKERLARLSRDAMGVWSAKCQHRDGAVPCTRPRPACVSTDRSLARGTLRKRSIRRSSRSLIICVVRLTVLGCRRCAANIEPTQRCSTALMKTSGAYKRHGQLSMPQTITLHPSRLEKTSGGPATGLSTTACVTSVVLTRSYRPRKIRNVTQRDHYELTVPLNGRIVVRRLAAEAASMNPGPRIQDGRVASRFEQ